ncbi:MAG: hypothetical protein PVS2B1_13840 [Candidatus Dormibacteraceae bacterium]
MRRETWLKPLTRSLSPKRKGKLVVVVALAAGLAVAACGNQAGAAKSSASPSPGRGGGQARNGAAGQLVQINGRTLILTGATGDITITFTASTTFSRTSTAVLPDIVPGACIVATGQKDSTGVLTASTVRLTPKTASGCGAGQFGPNPAPGASPRPTPSDQPGQPAMAVVGGEVQSATGTSITVLTAGSESQKIIVPTTANVTKTSTASSADLRTGECLRANGQRDAAGAVQATSITISPAGPSGTCATGIGGRGPGRPGAPGAGAPNN